MEIKVGIVGATGYAGAELVRLLMNHPYAKLTAISSVSFEGQRLSEIYPSYFGLCDMVCGTQEDVVNKCDVVFAALPHGLSQELAQLCANQMKLFIDLGADFRLEDEAVYKEWYGGNFLDQGLHEQAVYGLPELFRAIIRGKSLIANPGCYATAVPLALAPAMEAGLIETEHIIADCKSGITGAGRQPTQTTHFADCNEGFTAYKVAAHRHMPEIEQTLSRYSQNPVKITFVPHLLPVSRGILATCYATLKEGVTEEQIRHVYGRRYQHEYFVRFLPRGSVANIKSVKYTNFCDVSVHVDEHTETLVAISALDNMVKGAAGQAIQNMNLVLGLEEKTGLVLTPPAF